MTARLKRLNPEYEDLVERMPPIRVPKEGWYRRSCSKTSKYKYSGRDTEIEAMLEKNPYGWHPCVCTPGKHTQRDIANPLGTVVHEQKLHH